MADDGTPEQIRAQLVGVMGEPLAELVFELDNRFCEACLKWQQHEALFDSEEKVELLNKSAPAFFASLQNILIDDVVMHISRLTDNAKVAGKDTLSLDQMKKAVTDAALTTKLTLLIADVTTKTKPARDYRNTHGAHTSLAVVRGDQVVPGVSRAQVKAALQSIHQVFEAIRDHYNLTPVCMDVIETLGGVPSLLDVLRKGVKARQEERDRWRPKPK
jgi:hypothetical protein